MSFRAKRSEAEESHTTNSVLANEIPPLSAIWRIVRDDILFFKKLMNLSLIFKYKIIGTSMYPTLKSGQNILVNRLSYLLHEPKANNIVALKDPRDGKTLIKRIVEIDSAKQNAEYFVLGDNPKESTDSRTFGWIKKKDIMGKVIYYK